MPVGQPYGMPLGQPVCALPSATAKHVDLGYQAGDIRYNKIEAQYTIQIWKMHRSVQPLGSHYYP